MAAKINKSHIFKLITIIGIIVIVDLVVWRALVGSLLFLAISLLWAGFGFIGNTKRKKIYFFEWIGLGVGTLAISWMFGLVADRINEGAARSLATMAITYKNANGSFPPIEVANSWAKPILGYTQRYSLIGKDSAYVWFTKFNHRIQSISVATGQLQNEQDQ